MANKKITELPLILSGDISSNDVFPIVNVELDITNKVTVDQLKGYFISGTTEQNYKYIPSGVTITVPTNTQKFIYGDIVIDGELIIEEDSELFVLNGNVIASGGTITQFGDIVTVDLPEFNTFVTNGTFNPTTKQISFTGNFDFIPFNVDLNSLSTDNFYTTGATLNGSVVEFNRNDLTNAYSVDLSTIARIPFLEFNNTNKTVWNNGNGDILSNISFGDGALASNTTGSQNTAIGYNSLLSNTIGVNNVAVGPNTLRSNTTGFQNTTIGNNGLLFNTTGLNNTAIGNNTLLFNTTGSNNTANGQGSLQTNTTGGNNTAIGSFALLSNTTGGNNTANGAAALQNNTIGAGNTALGATVLLSNTSGNNNTAIGSSSLASNTTGGQNTAIGNNSLLSNTNGFANTATGANSLFRNMSGIFNVAIGVDSLFNITTGSSNIAIGVNSGSLTTGGTQNQTSSNSIYIGGETKSSTSGNTNEIIIGDNADGRGSNTTTLGNTSIVATYIEGQVKVGSFNGPPTGIEGAIYYDTITKKHYGFDGTNWNAFY
jgi:hypothetical protein